MKPVDLADLEGVEVIPSFRFDDERGSLQRIWPVGIAGLDFEILQALVVTNTHRHTLRGMHFQKSPFTETKIVGLLRGRIFDVVVDLRLGSPTYLSWASVELSADHSVGLLIPAGLAHGYISLDDDTQVTYLLDQPYDPSLASGVRWDDGLLNIEWPIHPAVVSEQDLSWPALSNGFSAL